MQDPWLSYNVIVLAALIAMFALLLLNLALFRSLRHVSSPTDGPLVSVLIPARNEEQRIGPCLRSLQEQAYPHFEVLVLNDNSEDGTERVVRAAGFDETAGRWRLINGEPLPAGWTGKNWACHQLALHARGDYLFFTDADTVHHHRDTLSSAIAMAQRHRADLLSAWPRLVTVTLGEKLVIPMIHLLAVVFYPHALLLLLQANPAVARRLPSGAVRSLGAANGQFLFFRREAYQQIGGHAAVRDHLVEDVALGREVAARVGDGFRLVNCDASHLVDCRMYTSLSEVWLGFTKNIRPAFEDSPGSFVLLGLVQFCCFFAPFLAVWLPGKERSLIAAQCGLILLIRFILAARFRTSWLGALLHPVGHALSMLIALNSWHKSAGKGVSWKGRTYQP